MKWIPAWMVALVITVPGGAAAMWQDAHQPVMLDPADIGTGWVLIDQQEVPATTDQPYVIQETEYAGPKGERVAINLALVEPGAEHINDLAVMLAHQAASFSQRADLLAQGAAATSPTDACGQGTWWQGTDQLLDDPAIVGMCGLADGAVAIVIANGPTDEIPDLAGQITELLKAALS